MHVAYIMGQGTGGLPHYTAELANAVAVYCEVTVLKPTETTADDVFDDSVSVVEAFEPTEISMQNIFDLNLNVRKNLRGLRSYRNIRELEDVDPDIVHDPTDEFPQVDFYAYRSKVYQDRPYVVTKHEVKHGGASSILKVADLVMSAVPDFPKAAGIVHSDRQREILAQQDRNFGTLRTIPHGVYSFFKELDYTEHEREDCHALFFGSLIPPKGVEYLIRAVPHIVEERPEFTVTIAGDGNIPDDCADLLAEYDDHIQVRNDFIPNDEVGSLFSRASVVVLPYRDGWQTGHSGTLSTAFAFGTPIVSSSVGDFDELVEDAGAGFTVEPENECALADALLDVFADESRRQEMAVASERMAERLSWENIGEKYVELYRELIDGE
jgi:glycosyltransferase involved in cell wall biosynthesis